MKKLLIVDDNTLNLDILKDALKEDYKLSFAKNGVIALKIMKKNLPDLILLDVMMPVMDGYETFRAMNEDEALKDTPVIFLSGVDKLDDDVFKVDPSKKIELIKKPFDLEHIKMIIESVLRK